MKWEVIDDGQQPTPMIELAELNEGGVLPVAQPEPRRISEAGSDNGIQFFKNKEVFSDYDDTLLPRSPNRRPHYPHLDVVRASCVILVTIDHAQGKFAEWNVFLAQNWVVQYLYIVCGICFGMSSKPLLVYLLRLTIYLCMGVSLNWLAWLYTGKDWRKDFFDVVFQFWFIVGLMLFSVILAPLRPHLARFRDRALAREARLLQAAGSSSDYLSCWNLFWGLLVMGMGCAAVWLFFDKVLTQVVISACGPSISVLGHALGPGALYWGMPMNIEETAHFVEKLCQYIRTSCVSVFIVILSPMLFNKLSITGWLVLLNMYGARCYQHRGQDERMWHGLDLMLIGVVCQYFGLWRRRLIGKVMIQYWMVFIFLATFLWPTGYKGRVDEHPPHDNLLRIRYQLLESLFTIMLLAAGERLVDPEAFTRSRLEILNYWALLLFIAHKAVHMVVPSPYNWFVLVSLLLPSWLLARC